jgi:hypothetical protein
MQTDVQGVIEHSKQNSFNVLSVNGKAVNVRFGAGQDPDRCTIEFGNAKAAAAWAATRIRNTRTNIKGQFIDHATWQRMEDAAARTRD